VGVAKAKVTFSETVELLRKHYGSPIGPPTAEPFELILWENVAYLAPPERRREAFERLKLTIGTAPREIRGAAQKDLERVTASGILKGLFAAKLRTCADIAINKFGGDLTATIRGPLDGARRALRLFPGIGEPGADKILLFTGKQACLAPESNGLRVLVRLGLLSEEKSYSRMYAASRHVATGLKADPAVMQEAHLLLQQHGRTLCRRSAPECAACPLAGICAYARKNPGRPETGHRPIAGRRKASSKTVQGG
jgi:endonuclease III